MNKLKAKRELKWFLKMIVSTSFIFSFFYFIHLMISPNYKPYETGQTMLMPNSKPSSQIKNFGCTSTNCYLHYNDSELYKSVNDNPTSYELYETEIEKMATTINHVAYYDGTSLFVDGLEYLTAHIYVLLSTYDSFLYCTNKCFLIDETDTTIYEWNYNNNQISNFYQNENFYNLLIDNVIWALEKGSKSPTKVPSRAHGSIVDYAVRGSYIITQTNEEIFLNNFDEFILSQNITTNISIFNGVIRQELLLLRDKSGYYFWRTPLATIPLATFNKSSSNECQNLMTANGFIKSLEDIKDQINDLLLAVPTPFSTMLERELGVDKYGTYSFLLSLILPGFSQLCDGKIQIAPMIWYITFQIGDDSFLADEELQYFLNMNKQTITFTKLPSTFESLKLFVMTKVIYDPNIKKELATLEAFWKILLIAFATKYFRTKKPNRFTTKTSNLVAKV